MVFDYTVIEHNVMADTESQEFVNHIGDILVVLLDEQLSGTWFGEQLKEGS